MLLNLLGYHWLITYADVQLLEYSTGIECILYCVLPAWNVVICCHPVFDSLYSLLKPLTFENGYPKMLLSQKDLEL